LSDLCEAKNLDLESTVSAIRIIRGILMFHKSRGVNLKLRLAI